MDEEDKEEERQETRQAIKDNIKTIEDGCVFLILYAIILIALATLGLWIITRVTSGPWGGAGESTWLWLTSTLIYT